MRHHRARTLIATGILALVASFTTVALASPGSGGVTTILASRAPLSDSVQVNDEKIKLQTKDATDFLVQTITFQPNGFSGWHLPPRRRDGGRPVRSDHDARRELPDEDVRSARDVRRERDDAVHGEQREQHRERGRVCDVGGARREPVPDRDRPAALRVVAVHWAGA